jgi:hypothetical protein
VPQQRKSYLHGDGVAKSLSFATYREWLYRVIFPVVGPAGTIIARAQRESIFMSRLRFLTAVFIILVTVGAISGQRSAIADEKDKLVGTWKLVSGISEELETGQKTDIYKGTPTGFITYGPDGRVMTIIVDSNRMKPAGAVATSAEAETLFRSMAAYAGTYSVRGNQVIHDSCGPCPFACAVRPA